jgi:hypothetical protein
MRFHLTQGVEMGRQCDIFISVVTEGEEVKGVQLIGEAVEVIEGTLRVDETLLWVTEQLRINAVLLFFLLQHAPVLRPLTLLLDRDYAYYKASSTTSSSDTFRNAQHRDP